MEFVAGGSAFLVLKFLTGPEKRLIRYPSGFRTELRGTPDVSCNLYRPDRNTPLGLFKGWGWGLEPLLLHPSGFPKVAGVQLHWLHLIAPLPPAVTLPDGGRRVVPRMRLELIRS